LNSARAKNGDPIAFWQLRQWQIRTLIGSPSALNRTAPHRHPPSWVIVSPLVATIPAPRPESLTEKAVSDFGLL
jgi:hypothetical protein